MFVTSKLIENCEKDDEVRFALSSREMQFHNVERKYYSKGALFLSIQKSGDLRFSSADEYKNKKSLRRGSK